MTVDVIIPTRDRPSQLAATLSALAAQDFTDFGVIVVDDGSARPVQHDLPTPLMSALPIRFVRNVASIGPGLSRNKGVHTSTARFIVFLDDDCIADPQLIGRHRSELTRVDGPVVSLGPILHPSGQRLSVWNHWDADRLEREYARLGEGAPPTWTHVYTGNLGLRRADFLAVGGFDGRFARQEDVELGYRLAAHGCHFAFDRQAVVYHDSNRSLRTWLRIPAASAAFDLLMDDADPESDRLEWVITELDAKHWALRAVRRSIQAPAARRSTVRLAVAAGRALHAMHADRLALPAMSVAWDLTYCEALREAVSARAHARSA